MSPGSCASASDESSVTNTVARNLNMGDLVQSDCPTRTASAWPDCLFSGADVRKLPDERSNIAIWPVVAMNSNAVALTAPV